MKTSNMDYEKKYKEALERAKEWFKPEEPDSYTCIVESIFPEFKESKDEKIREAIYNCVRWFGFGSCFFKYVSQEECFTWLKKQCEHARFIEAIQVGDQVTKNEDGVLVNLSQLKRVAKKDEKQGEMKPADKVEPKFKVSEQKPAWSEEDEELYNELSDTYFYNDEDYPEETYKRMLKKVLDWMTKHAKSLRPQNWTKEDKERYISCLQRLSTGNPEQPETINSKWFKEHVYTQNTWKPSDEQMKAIEDAIEFLGCTKKVREDLKSLYKQLKKL